MKYLLKIPLLIIRPLSLTQLILFEKKNDVIKNVQLIMATDSNINSSFFCANSSLKYHFYAFAKSNITATTDNMPCQTTLTESRQYRMSRAVHTWHVHVSKTAGWSPAELNVQS